MIRVEEIKDVSYLGDGAYVGQLDGQIVVYASNGVEVSSVVYLDLEGAVMLKSYIEKRWKMSND